jgi:hypothetical protein
MELLAIVATNTKVTKKKKSQQQIYKDENVKKNVRKMKNEKRMI